MRHFYDPDLDSPTQDKPMHFEFDGMGNFEDVSYYGADATPTQTRQQRARGMRVILLVTQLDEYSDSEILDSEEVHVDKEGQDGVHNTNRNGIKFLYKDEIWTQNYCTYDPLVVEFAERRESTQFF